MFDNLTLKKRMLIGYAIPMVMYVGLASLVYTKAYQGLDTFQAVKRVQDVIIDANDMALNAQGMIRSLRGFVADKNQGFEQEYQSAYEKAIAAADETQKLVQRQDQIDRLNQMRLLIKEYDDYARRIISLTNQSKQAEAIAIFRSRQGKEFVDRFTILNQEFSRNEQNFLNQRTEQASNALVFLVFSTIVGSVGLIAIKLIMAIAISQSVAKKIDQEVSAIASSSAEIAAAIEEQERTTSQQAVSVNQTTTTMHELGTSAQSTAEQAEAAATGTRQALALVDGGDRLQRGNVSSLRERVGQISQQILRLSEQTHQIGSISTLVSDLANQTNMLALNAAVEAVRAGEHGRGFGVVASEIRKLADQSRKSAEKISSLVAEIQNSTHATVLATDEGSKTVDSVVESINTVAVNAQQISLTAKQQAIAIQQVVEAMNNINQGAAQTASGIAQVKIGTEKLNSAAVNLKAVV